MAALSAEGFDLNVGVGDFGFEAAGFAVGSGQTFFGLRELIAQARRGRDRVENRDARFFLLALDFGETRGGGSGVLLAESEIALRGGQVGGGGFENLAVGFALGFERGQAMTGLRQFGFGRCGAHQQLGATLFVVAAAGVGAVDFEGDLADAVAVLAQLGFDGVAALGALGVLGFELLHGLGAMLHFFGEGIELRIEFGAFLLDGGELAGQNQAQLGAHFFAQARIALGLGGLALQRIHLARDFVEDVVDAGQVQLGVFQAGFGEALLGFEFRDARGFFENRAAVGGTAAEDLADASLLDERVGLGAEAGAHEQFLNVAQAAEFAVQQIFAVAGAEQAARDHDFAGAELLLVELAAANFQHNVRGDGADRRGGRGRGDVVRGQREDGFVVGEGDGDDVDFRARDFDFFGLAGLGVFDGLFGGLRRRGRGWRLRPSRRRCWLRGKIVLDVDFGGRVGVGAVVGFGVDQGQRHFGHAGGLAVARAGEDDVFHAGAAQGLGRLLAQHPGDGVGNIRLAAAVGADDGRHTVPVELEFGAVAERLEPENLKPLQFEQRELLENQWPVVSGQLPVVHGRSPVALPTAWTRVFTNEIPPRQFDACRITSERHSHPRLDRAGTKLSYCNGEIGAGSSNITPYMVWAYERPRWVAHTLQQLDGFQGEGREVGESREQHHASAFASRKQRWWQ